MTASARERSPHAVVTGACGDIGAALVDQLLSTGCTVTGLDVVPPKTERTTRNGLSSSVEYVLIDVSDRAAVDELVDGLPALDIVIGAAGIVRSSPFLEITTADWQAHLDVNLTACFHVGQSAARRMVRDGRGGSILFVASWVHDHPWPEIASYVVSKAGLVALTRSMAAELATHGVRVNAIAPGIVRAGMAKQQLDTDPAYAAKALKSLPLGRFQTVHDVAAAAGFLVSDGASYITGSVLLADGGSSLLSGGA